MPIEMPSATATPVKPTKMASEKTHSKGEKKHKSSEHGEKKRKRDRKEDGHKSKSKKQKSDKSHKTTGKASNTPGSQEISPFHMQTCSLYLPLAPVSQRYPLEGICAEHLSPLILQYYPPFSAVILAYNNPRLTEKPFGTETPTELLMQNIDEYAFSWTWVTADFLLFKMEKGVEIEAYINLQNEGHLGLVCWNLFNASVERKRLPADWKWVGIEELERSENAEENLAPDGAGYYADGEGKKVEGKYKFRIKDVQVDSDPQRGFVSIEGTMLDVEAEDALAESEKRAPKKSNDGRRPFPSKAIGATVLGTPYEKDENDEFAKKPRRKY